MNAVAREVTRRSSGTTRVSTNLGHDVLLCVSREGIETIEEVCLEDWLRAEQSDGESPRLGYDAQGNLTSLAAANAVPVRLVYDEERRVRRVIERDGAELRYDYDGSTSAMSDSSELSTNHLAES